MFFDCGYAQPPERRDGLACWVMVSSVPITLFIDGLSIKDARPSRRSTMHIMHGYHPIPSHGGKPFSLTFSRICSSVPEVSTVFCDILSDRNHINSALLTCKRYEINKFADVSIQKFNKNYFSVMVMIYCTWEYIDWNFILS